MISTLSLDIINFLWYGFLNILWPSSIAGLDLNSISAAVNTLLTGLMPVIRFINIFAPVWVFFTWLGIAFTLYTTFFVFQIGRFFINVLRGSGA